uniref:Gustatory receptor n=1 Tax=Anopheles merus TaxID=30066 RepID=A0A182UQQ3_ANOME
MLKVLNIFHTLLICNVRTVRPTKGHQPAVGYKISRARVQLLLPLVVIFVLAFLNPWTTHRRKDQHTINLNLFTIYARLLVTVLIVVLLICDNFRQRFHLLSLLHTLPGSAFTGRKGSQFSVKKLQLVILLICNVLSISEALYKIYQSRQYSYSLGVVSGVLVEHYILLNLLLCQLLAETLSNAYATLQHSLRVRPFHAIIRELTVLDGCKNHLSEVIGLKLILVILHLMFNVSFCTYDILEHVLSEKHLRDITRLSIIAVQETVMLFGLCFQFTMLDRKLHRTEQQKSNSYIFRNRNLLWNTAILSSLTLVSATSALLLLLHDFTELLTTVMGVITMILYGIRLVVVVPLICWTLLNGRTLVDISNRALAIERQFGSDRVVLINVWLLTQTQICIALVMLLFNIVVQLYYILSFDLYQKGVNIVVVFVFFVLEAFISLHRGYVQFWPAFLSHRYAKLISRAAYKHNHSLQTVMALGSDLESFKRKCSSIFGLMQLLHLLNIFVTCSVEAYIVLHVIDIGLGVHYVAMNLVSALTYALVIADHFNELVCRVKNEPNEPDMLQTVNTIWDDLEHYKQRTIATFGVMNVLHALDALVKCAVETYVIFSTWEMGFGLLGAFLDIITLTMYAATFFIFAFAHDRVEVKFRYNLSYELYLVLHANLLVELSMDLQKLFLLYFALYMIQRYRILANLLDRSDPTTVAVVFQAFEDLTTFKKHLSKTFGLHLLALILQTFVACSIHAYLIVVEQRHIFQLIANVAQLVINLTLFFILTYYYDYVEIKVGVAGRETDEDLL